MGTFFSSLFRRDLYVVPIWPIPTNLTHKLERRTIRWIDCVVSTLLSWTLTVFLYQSLPYDDDDEYPLFCSSFAQKLWMLFVRYVLLLKNNHHCDYNDNYGVCNYHYNKCYSVMVPTYRPALFLDSLRIEIFILRLASLPHEGCKYCDEYYWCYCFLMCGAVWL